jgi:hypothetical protein
MPPVDSVFSGQKFLRKMNEEKSVKFPKKLMDGFGGEGAEGTEVNGRGKGEGMNAKLR